MDISRLSDEIFAAILIVTGLLVAKPVISWLLAKLYNLFIGAGHI